MTITQTRSTETEPRGAETLTDEALAELLGDAPETPETFIPTDAAGVDWVLRKVNAARAEARLIRENGEKMAREAERKAEHLEWKYGAAIQTWLRAELAGGTKKSRTLYHGTVGFRAKPAGLDVTDPGAALAWVRENLPDALRLDKKALSDALLSTGESVDFAAFTPAEDVFYVK